MPAADNCKQICSQQIELLTELLCRQQKEIAYDEKILPAWMKQHHHGSTRCITPIRSRLARTALQSETLQLEHSLAGPSRGIPKICLKLCSFLCCPHCVHFWISQLNLSREGLHVNTPKTCGNKKSQVSRGLPLLRLMGGEPALCLTILINTNWQIMHIIAKAQAPAWFQELLLLLAYSCWLTHALCPCGTRRDSHLQFKLPHWTRLSSPCNLHRLWWLCTSDKQTFYFHLVRFCPTCWLMTMFTVLANFR